MADPQTVNRGLFVPVRGSDPGTWDVPLNANSATIDQLFGAVLAVSTTGGTTDLSAAQCNNGVILVTGALVGAALIRVQSVSAYYIVSNFTTGNFTLQFSTFSGAGQIIAVEQGSTVHIYTDGTNTKLINLPPVGTYLDVCDAAIPAWINACTVPPYLNCDGTTFNAATYPYLNVKLGGNTLPDLRGTSRYALNQGTSRLTTAGSGLDGNTRFAVKTTQSQTLITANLPPYTPTVSNISLTATIANNQSVVLATAGAGLTYYGPFANQGTNPTTAPVTGTITLNAQGGTSTAFGLTSTGTISGLMLIRAA